MRAILPLPPLACALTLALASLGLSGCMMSAPSYAPPPDLQSVGLVHRWDSQIGLTGGEQVDSAWRVGDSIYVTTNHKRIMRFIAASGVKAWDIALGVHTQHIFRPVDIDAGHVLVCNQDTAFLLDKPAGIETMSKPLGFIATTDPLVDFKSNTLAVGGLEFFHGVYLDRLEGEKWVVAAHNDVFAATPAVIGDNFLLASRNGLLSRINAADGLWVWQNRKTNGEVVAPLATDGASLFIPCLDNRVYAFNANTGGELWEVRIDGRLDKAAIPVQAQVLVPAAGKGLYSLSTDDGSTQWMANGVDQVATITGDHLWAEDEYGNLKSIGLEKGEILSSTPIPAAGLAVYNTDDDMVILVNKSGTISAFAPH